MRLAVMLLVRFALSLRNVEDVLHEHDVDFSHEKVRCWWHRLASAHRQGSPLSRRKTSPDIIRLVEMLYARFLRSLRKVEDWWEVTGLRARDTITSLAETAAAIFVSHSA
jgi:transposase-like protein